MSIDEGIRFATVLPEADPPLAETYKNTGPYLQPIPVRELPSKAKLPLTPNLQSRRPYGTPAGA